MGILGEENPIHGEAWDDRVARDLVTAYMRLVWRSLKYGRRKVSESRKKSLI